AHGHDQPGEQRAAGQRDDGGPPDQLHRDPRGTHRLCILAGHRRAAEHQVRDDRTDPAERESEMDGERKLAEAGPHDHGRGPPAAGGVWPPAPPVGTWRPGPCLPPTPVAMMTTTARTKTSTTIPNTFTQRGVPG